MYASTIATDMFTLRGFHEFERMDDAQLSDIGIVREGNVFFLDGRVVYELPKFNARTFLKRIVSTLTRANLLSVRTNDPTAMVHN